MPDAKDVEKAVGEDAATLFEIASRMWYIPVTAQEPSAKELAVLFNLDEKFGTSVEELVFKLRGTLSDPKVRTVLKGLQKADLVATKAVPGSRTRAWVRTRKGTSVLQDFRNRRIERLKLFLGSLSDATRKEFVQKALDFAKAIQPTT